ncbi:hypothetical protein HS088_TW06G00508 [Tripterygium wilfordii]|uniref:Uncharacterized protein n=1 Tax=Tripterygium wilfordii TaxID=458696 RepID=A0A7J7DJ37_TRIWF|nr:uncharacterized protein LOC120000232 [Tripterygium wilfordii]XP_038704115.1 uncharacterized protein LOC120000232 [Tripterygium wilfordii]XP_038704116.1 uncharacterized protein LOC120000232 [Tripterygium wilfordii]XP_038704117.1 uncharacterized protein LOC120000232 [Tripterygium wilfordii]XP_038704118.1 uncharacterized protein LOC120000232 [Tripterygium wilfordii]XP_038704119.1 uncharacterized protein LOC120000232 [Tripterygium wilfordii]XP_038704120.1 uncharacterized protein LOC120000232 [
MAGVKRRICCDSEINGFHKELDEVSCAICMDHPHNDVLILCSSHENGCRSYICDTSYRHSNCLDRFKKSRTDSMNDSTLPSILSSVPYSSILSSDDLDLPLRTDIIEGNDENNANERNTITSFRMPEGLVENNIHDHTQHLAARREANPQFGNIGPHRGRHDNEELDVVNLSESRLSLKCPLCRGDILGWKVVEEARKYLNSKKRSCTREACSFLGNYQELRRHARRLHPTTRPSNVDPSRERAWRRLEHQREYGDIVSAICSAIPGTVVVGDYAIETGDMLPVERGSGAGEPTAPWRTAFFLLQMIDSMDRVGEPRGRSRAWTRHRRNAGALADRRYLWGENLLGLQDENDDNEDDSHVLDNAREDVSPIPRRRKRLLCPRTNEDRP